MGLLLQQLGSQRLLNHLFMVEFVEPIPTKITGLTNIDVRQDNNIVVSEEEVQNRRNKATRKKKYIRIVGCQKPLEVCWKGTSHGYDEVDHESWYGEDNDCEEYMNKKIWEGELNMIVLNGNQFLAKCGEENKSKVNKHILHYY